MAVDNILIIDETEVSTMTGSWTEYLCLRKLSSNRFELSVRGFQILGEIKDYYDERSDTYSYPDKINGWSVRGAEGEYVVGHLMVNQSDEIMPIEFSSVDEPEVMEWLSYPKKYDDKIINDIRSHIEKS